MQKMMALPSWRDRSPRSFTREKPRTAAKDVWHINAAVE
jgi:hypothetical protein